MSPVQTVAPPPLTVMAPGIAGDGLMLAASVIATLVPQPLLAPTETLPPADPTVAVIELVADEPVHPAGKAQV